MNKPSLTQNPLRQSQGFRVRPVAVCEGEVAFIAWTNLISRSDSISWESFPTK